MVFLTSEGSNNGYNQYHIREKENFGYEKGFGYKGHGSTNTSKVELCCAGHRIRLTYWRHTMGIVLLFCMYFIAFVASVVSCGVCVTLFVSVQHMRY